MNFIMLNFRNKIQNYCGAFGNQSKRLITYMLIVFIWMLAIAATYPIYESTIYRVSQTLSRQSGQSEGIKVDRL